MFELFCCLKMVCAQNGCVNNARYRKFKHNNPIFCHVHRQDGMIDHYLYCRYNDGTNYCPVSGNYGYLDNKKNRYCSKHKKNDMINIGSYCSVNEDGIFCDSIGNYYVGKKKYCRKHQKEQNDGIVTELNKKVTNKYQNTFENVNNSSHASTTETSKKLVNYSETETESECEDFSRASTTGFSKKKRIIDDTDSDDETKSYEPTVETVSHTKSKNYFDKMTSDKSVELIMFFIKSISTQNNIMMLYETYRKLNTQNVKNKVVNSLIEFISDKIDELEQQKSLKRKRT